jgi:hypothetical protein
VKCTGVVKSEGAPNNSLQRTRNQPTSYQLRRLLAAEFERYVASFNERHK